MKLLLLKILQTSNLKMLYKDKVQFRVVLGYLTIEWIKLPVYMMKDYK